MSWVTQREVSCNPMWDEPNWNDEEKEIPSNLQVKYMKIVESLFSDDSWLILPYLNLVLLRDDMTDFWHFLYLMLWRVNWKSEQSSPETGMAKSTSLDETLPALVLWRHSLSFALWMANEHANVTVLTAGLWRRHFSFDRLALFFWLRYINAKLLTRAAINHI